MLHLVFYVVSDLFEEVEVESCCCFSGTKHSSCVQLNIGFSLLLSAYALNYEQSKVSLWSLTCAEALLQKANLLTKGVDAV